jgi:hypothetical protein
MPDGRSGIATLESRIEIWLVLNQSGLSRYPEDPAANAGIQFAV